MRIQAVSKKHLLAVLLVCSLVTSLAGRRIALPLRHATQVVLAPLGDAPMYAATSLAAALTGDQGETLSKAEAEKLKAENDDLRRQADHWQAASEYYYRQNLKLENFRQMYRPISDVACELIPARVVGAGSLSYDQGRVLNSGARVGVDAGELVAVRDQPTERDMATSRAKALPPNLAVVTESSLVGRVVDSGAFSARMQLVTDKHFEMTGCIRRLISPGRPRTIMTEGPRPRTERLDANNNARIDVLFTGDGAGMIVVPGVKAYHNVLPGDYLYASTAEQNIPIEIRVGEVVKVEPSPDPKDAHRVRLFVRPHEEVAKVRDVFIISPIAPRLEKR